MVRFKEIYERASKYDSSKKENRKFLNDAQRLFKLEGYPISVPRENDELEFSFKFKGESWDEAFLALDLSDGWMFYSDDLGYEVPLKGKITALDVEGIIKELQKAND